MYFQPLPVPSSCMSELVALLLLGIASMIHASEGLAPDAARLFGQVQPRHARDIVSSRFSIGAETMDRDYTIYANWREYLGPLGAKRARIQSGWAKCDDGSGNYRWDWLDEIIPDMVEQGCTSPCCRTAFQARNRVEDAVMSNRPKPPWAHCITRCVRRAFLCGTDHSGNEKPSWIGTRQKGRSDTERVA